MLVYDMNYCILCMVSMIRQNLACPRPALASQLHPSCNTSHSTLTMIHHSKPLKLKLKTVSKTCLHPAYILRRYQWYTAACGNHPQLIRSCGNSKRPQLLYQLMTYPQIVSVPGSLVPRLIECIVWSNVIIASGEPICTHRLYYNLQLQ